MYDNDCMVCKHRKDTMKRRRLMKHRQRKDHWEALRAGLKSGKVVRITDRDEFTGFCYRVDRRTGDWVVLGSGINYGA
jgi:hypothetical protein